MIENNPPVCKKVSNCAELNRLTDRQLYLLDSISTNASRGAYTKKARQSCTLEKTIDSIKTV